MLILGIETATERVGVSIGGHDGVVASFQITRGRRHAETLVPAIEFVCREADVTLAEIGAIAVDVGPGLFTGMRVGIATAKAMAAALEVPVITATSLELLALAVAEDDRVVVPVVDARKGEVFFSMYRGDDTAVRAVATPSCAPIDAVVAAVIERGQSVVAVGDGARRYQETLAADHRVEIAAEMFDHPSADTLVRFAHRRSLREDWIAADRVEAFYLRQPDAEINWTTRADRA